MSVISIWIPYYFLVFLVSMPSLTFSLSFSLPTIVPADGNVINITGDAYISSQGEGIQVTNNERSRNRDFQTGRATYNQPLHLWDKASGDLTGFSTNFSFVIDSDGSRTYGDGLAFIMVPLDSQLTNESYGLGLGYGTLKSLSNTSAETYLAVEFDTAANINEFDPPYEHVGININSLRSNATARWDNNITGGTENNAWISYNASSMVLRVDFTAFTNSGMTVQILSHVVDLREYLPERVLVGFSAATGTKFEKNNVRSWNFSSKLNLDAGKGSDKRWLITGLSVGLSVTLLASAFMSYFVWRRRKKNKHQEEWENDEFGDMGNEFEKGSGPKKFSYIELFRATNNFSDDEKLGEGGFGGVYRGFLEEMNSFVAVKRVSQGSKQGLKEYASEVRIISQLRHRNLVRLVGWCHERGELLLVYEFMPNGSLDFHLFKGKSVLTWEVRYKIALGLASALLYLHEEWERCVVHRDIKTSNIMLDSSFNAKLGDFGLVRLVDHNKGLRTTVLAGTMGYMAPECVITGRASKESDIYSFGVVLVEIASGRRTFDQRVQEGQIRLAEWVWSLYGLGQLGDAADPGLDAEYDAREMERLMVVGLWCVHPDSDGRPSIRQAIHILNFEAELPTLPSAMPVPTYFAPLIGANRGLNVQSAVTSDSEANSYYTHYSNVASSSSGSATALLTS